MSTFDDILAQSSASLNALGNNLYNAAPKIGGIVQSGVFNAAQNAANNSGLGKALNKLGIPLFQGQFGSGVAPGSWLARGLSRPDPLINLDWQIEMPDGLDASYVEEIQASMADFAVSEGVFKAGTRQYYVGAEDIGALSITFYEDRLMTATQYLQRWRNRIRNSDGTRNYPSQYKRTIRVWPTDGAGIILGEFVYQGCWPSKIPTIAWTSQGTARIMHQVDFSVDSVEINLRSATNGTGLNGTPDPLFGSIEDFVNGLPLRLTNKALGAATTQITKSIGKLFG
jgi:hypothetical protein